MEFNGTQGPYASPCRIWTQILDRHDGTFIVRYKMFQACNDVEINITWQGQHIAESPYKLPGRIYSDDCNCPQGNLDEFITQYECSTNVPQMESDLDKFENVIFDQVLAEALKRFNHPGSYSFCHYVVLNNQVANNITINCLNSCNCFGLTDSSTLLWSARWF